MNTVKSPRFTVVHNYHSHKDTVYQAIAHT